MAKNEKTFPLLVTTENGLVESCGQENCRKWGSGALRVEKLGRNASCAAKAFMSMAGCEVCAGPVVRQSDLSIIPEFTYNSDTPFEEVPVESLIDDARKSLAASVNSLLMPEETGQL